MLSDSNNIRIAFAVVFSLLLHATFLSLDHGKVKKPEAGSIRKKVTVRLVPRRAPEKPVAKSAPKVEKKTDKISPLQMPKPVEVAVKEIPPVFMPEAPEIPELKTDPEPVEESSTPEIVQTGEAEAKDSPEVILATPLYRKNPPPDYPAKARRRHQQGAVILLVAVDREGNVEKLEVGESSGFGILDKAALKAVRSWIFKPGSRGGEPVAMQVLVPVRFSLR